MRSVEAPPLHYRYKPVGKLGTREKIILGLDEFEAIRLADHLGLDHSEASEIMGVSRPTFTRLLEGARHNLSKLIVEGKELEIKGGKIMFAQDVVCCRKCRRPYLSVEGQEPVCPTCKGSDFLKPQAHCNGNCQVCEEA